MRKFADKEGDFEVSIFTVLLRRNCSAVVGKYIGCVFEYRCNISLYCRVPADH